MGFDALLDRVFQTLALRQFRGLGLYIQGFTGLTIELRDGFRAADCLYAESSAGTAVWKRVLDAGGLPRESWPHQSVVAKTRSAGVRALWIIPFAVRDFARLAPAAH